jgi:SPP1 family predicted phage head-tail adaptor
VTIAAKLRHRVTFQSPTQAQDPSTGAVTVTWADWLANEPAEVVPISGKEFIQSGATQAGVDTRMTVRWRSGVEPTMRIVFDGQNYNIHAVLPDPMNRRWLTIMCQRGVNDGE